MGINSEDIKKGIDTAQSLAGLIPDEAKNTAKNMLAEELKQVANEFMPPQCHNLLQTMGPELFDSITSQLNSQTSTDSQGPSGLDPNIAKFMESAMQVIAAEVIGNKGGGEAVNFLNKAMGMGGSTNLSSNFADKGMGMAMQMAGQQSGLTQEVPTQAILQMAQTVFSDPDAMSKVTSNPEAFIMDKAKDVFADMVGKNSPIPIPKVATDLAFNVAKKEAMTTVAGLVTGSGASTSAAAGLGSAAAGAGASVAAAATAAAPVVAAVTVAAAVGFGAYKLHQHMQEKKQDSKQNIDSKPDNAWENYSDIKDKLKEETSNDKSSELSIEQPEVEQSQNMSNGR